MSDKADYHELINMLKAAEEACKEMVRLMQLAQGKIGEIDEYPARLVAGEIHRLVITLENCDYSGQKVGSIPYLISRLERHLEDLDQEVNPGG